MVLPRKEDMATPPTSALHCRQRAVTFLDSTCDCDVKLLNKAEYMSLATPLVGVPALAVVNHHALTALACNLAMTISSRSTALAAVNAEQVELRKAILDN